MSARKTFAALVVAAVAAAAGCCTTNRFTTALPLGPDGEACETTCERALSEHDDDFVSCRFGFDDDGERAVLCTFERTTCQEPH